MLYFLLGLLLVTIILALPVSLRYDSSEKGLRVRWLGLTFTTKAGKKKPEKTQKKDTAKKKRRGFANLGLLWQRRELVKELIGKALGFVWEVGRTLAFRDSAATLSLPDPMWNGMLSAVLLNVNLQNINLSVNFEDRNYAKIRVTIYPYRVLGKLAVFLYRLPYLRLARLAWDLKRAR
ncbi:MAG: hypothetical protein PHX53_16455 [Syntrophales bacterium]|nr:hypothetical protein [Syntrophales bacterium]